MTSNATHVWKECKEFIKCDAEGCENSKPANRCGKCHMVYYCSRACQENHWRVHRADCEPIDDMRESILGVGKHSGALAQIEPDEETVQKVLTSSAECGICQEPLSATNGNPIVLAECHHVFCFSCLKEWNDHQVDPLINYSGHLSELPSRYTRQAPTCPLCRKAMPHVSEAPMKNARQLLAQASLKQETSVEECQELSQQAMKQLKSILSEKDKLPVGDQIQAAVLEGEAAIYSQDYETAISVFQEASQKMEQAVERYFLKERLMKQAERYNRQDKLDEGHVVLDQVIELNRQGHAEPCEHVITMLKLGQSQRLAKQWQEAKATYQDIAKRYMGPGLESSMTPQQGREIFSSISECAYHLGHMDMAIRLGQQAIEMNRYFPWSHKFVALAKKKEGDLEGAKQVAAEAVIYEAPWDDKHKEKVQEWYSENFS